MVFFQDQWHLLISKHSNSDARFLAKIKVHSWTRHKLYAPAIVIVVRCACMSWLILWGALAIAPCILLYVNRRELNSLVGSQNRFKCDWIYGFFMQQFFFSSTSFYSSVVRPSWHHIQIWNSSWAIIVPWAWTFITQLSTPQFGICILAHIAQSNQSFEFYGQSEDDFIVRMQWENL